MINADFFLTSLTQKVRILTFLQEQTRVGALYISKIQNNKYGTGHMKFRV